MESNKLVYDAVNKTVLSLVPNSTTDVLDLGCGSGALGAALRNSRPCKVTGLTFSEDEAAVAETRIDRVILGDLNTFDFSALGDFDCIIMSHILEHLYSPNAVLGRIGSALRPGAVIIVALPNILFWKQRKEFIMGRWRYQDGGIMDRTHVRYFDVISSEKLLTASGYKILEKKHSGVFPLTRPVRKLIGPLGSKIDVSACRWMPGFFAWQFVYLATRSSDLNR